MSQVRRCGMVLASDGKWYMELGDFEYAFDSQDCTWYGPFDSEEAASTYLYHNFTNPGGGEIDDSGVEAPPKEFKRVQ
ncbi:hypothetical protein ACI2KR_31450 [Pseudomonas luteola]